MMEKIRQSILLIRGQRVMLDRDLAMLYGVETRVLNQAVKRNHDRFPDDFMFTLTREEITGISQSVISSLHSAASKYPQSIDRQQDTHLKSQSVTSSWGGRRTLPYAFTEQGVAMLSSVLNSSRAIQANIAIMRAFVQLRAILSTHADLSRKMEELEKKYDSQFRVVFDAIRQLMTPPETPRKRIGFHVREKPAVYRVNRKNKRYHA